MKFERKLWKWGLCLGALVMALFSGCGKPTDLEEPPIAPEDFFTGGSGPLVDELRRTITDGMPLPEIVDAFEAMCQMPAENAMILFETGTFDFTGEDLFCFDLTRQFGYDEEYGYTQVHVLVLYAPGKENEGFSEATWSDLIPGDIFDHIRDSKAYQWACGAEYITVCIYQTATD